MPGTSSPPPTSPTSRSHLENVLAWSQGGRVRGCFPASAGGVYVKADASASRRALLVSVAAIKALTAIINSKKVRLLFVIWHGFVFDGNYRIV